VKSLGRVLPLYVVVFIAQLFGAPVLGSLSDRFGRRPVLLVSLAASTCLNALMALALHLQSLPLLALACLLAALAEANIAIAQSAFLAVAALLLATLALTAARFRETHAPDPSAPLGLGAAVRNVGAAFSRGG
jgi:MFS family permease